MIKKISDRIWYLPQDVKSDRPVLGYILGDRFSFAVDAGASEAHVKLFYESLQHVGLPLPTFTGISHYHWDHSYGTAFVHGISLASDLCNKELEKEATWKWTLPAMEKRVEEKSDILFGFHSKLAEYGEHLDRIKVVPATISLSSSTVVDLGGIRVEIIYCGGTHSDDSMVFYVPDEKFLFLGDATGKELFSLDWDYDPKHPEELQNIISALPFNQKKLKQIIAVLDPLDFESCFFAHEDVPCTKKQLMDYLNANSKE